MKNNRDAAVVFGLFETGLAVIRSLGRKGIQVYGVDYKKDIAWHSRYVHPLLCPHPANDRREFVEWIIREFGSVINPIPAFITGDIFLQVLSEER